ncbi:MAG: ribosome small subunit-dependent GTPase A [Candidatus Omnitrophica bacterium]|nr:ribosome small subunit-dependent GTPase A [Candidatus Omnitrophota bacterium]
MKKDILKINLEEIGYNEFFDNNLKNSTLVPARIISEHKELYVLRNEITELSAKITGKMIFTASSREDYPAVGDWVLITVLDKQQAVIHEILPRKTVLTRKSVNNSDKQLIAANVDVALIIQSTDRDYNLNRFERYITLVESENIKPVIVLNKTDLLSNDELNVKIVEIKERFNDIEIYPTSIISGEGIVDLKNSIKKGLTYCFLGSSGVGKSSIINTVSGGNLIKTAEISACSNRGKHITTHRELFILDNGGILVDNPGMREIGVLDSETGIKSVFSEIYELSKKCKFLDCRHINEPGCAVLKAIASGSLDKGKYDNYINLVNENEYNTMNKLEKREKDRKFGQFIKTAKKQIKKLNKQVDR